MLEEPKVRFTLGNNYLTLMRTVEELNTNMNIRKNFTEFLHSPGL